MDPHENKRSSEKEPTSEWSLFTIPRANGDGNPIVEKVGTRSYDEPTSLTGSGLRRIAENQASNTYPDISDIDMVDVLITDPRAEGRYAYIRLRPGSADCYHIIINSEGAKANVGQNIPIGRLDLDIPAEGVLTVAIKSNVRLHENNKPEGAVDTGLIELLDICREAAEPIEPEVRGRKKSFGAAIIRRISGR